MGGLGERESRGMEERPRGGRFDRDGSLNGDGQARAAAEKRVGR